MDFKRIEPEWGSDFGPPAGRLKRLLWAAACIAFVIAFLTYVVVVYRPESPAPAAWDFDVPVWVVFVPFAVLLVVLSLASEKIALWIQRKCGWKSEK